MPYANITPQQMGAIGQFNPTGWQNYWQDPAALAMLSGVRMGADGKPVISLNGQEVPWLNYDNGSGVVDLGNNKGYYLDWNPTSSTNDGTFGGIPTNTYGNGFGMDNVRSARQIDDLNAWMTSGQNDWLDNLMTIAAPALIAGAGLFGGATNGFGNPFDFGASSAGNAAGGGFNGLNGSTAVSGLGTGTAAPGLSVGGAAPTSLWGGADLAATFPGAYGAGFGGALGGSLGSALGGLPPMPPGIPGGGGGGAAGAATGGAGNAAGAAGAIGRIVDGTGTAADWASLALGGLGSIGGYLGAANAPDKITQTTEPWSAQQPYLIDLFKRAQGAVNQSGDPTRLQQMATYGAENMMQNPLFAQSEQNIGQLMASDPANMFGVGMGNAYMGMDNPYLQKTIDATSQDVLRNMQGQFNTAQRQSGSYGNSGLQEMYAREVPKALGNIANQQRFGAYQQDAGLYENMLNRSMNQYNTAYNARNNAAFNTPAWGGQMMGVAGQAYGMGQQQAAQPFDSLNQYKNLVGGTGYGQTASQPNYTNPWASALGGAMGGWQLGKLF